MSNIQALATGTKTIGNVNLAEVKESLLRTFNPKKIRKQDKVGLHFLNQHVYHLVDGEPCLAYNGGSTLSTEEYNEAMLLLQEFAELNKGYQEDRKRRKLPLLFVEPERQGGTVVDFGDSEDEGN